MKPILALACGLVLTSLTGCGTPAETRSGDHMVGVHNLWANQAYREIGVNGAVMRERTIYPHHFQDGRAVLNPLGLRDVGILADLYRDGPGSLSVRQGAADDALYQARLEAVRTALESSGIDSALVDLSDGTPGGDGSSSARAIAVLAGETGTATSGTETNRAPSTGEQQ